MDDHITIRPAAPEDASLLFTLFAEEKAAELAPLGLSAAQLQPLLEMQYRGREFSYSQSSDNLADNILCAANGAPVGRLLVDRQPECIRVMDIAVLLAHRNRGIATQALRHIQHQAAGESRPVRLRVMQNSPAENLYRRLGFTQTSQDEISSEMEWRPQSAASPNTAGHPPDEMHTRRPNHGEIVHTIVTFLKEIELQVEFGAISSGDFLPGIQIISNGLRIDPDELLYPGDLLHEAGHLAVMPPARRLAVAPVTADAAEEMGALAWSYAAALHIGLNPRIVFHEHGYRGQAEQLLHDFASGNAIGLPYLWWIGMTTQPQPPEPSIYPRMLHWLREQPSSTQAADTPACALQAHA